MNPRESIVVIAGYGEVGGAIGSLCQDKFQSVIVEDPQLSHPGPLTEAEEGKVAALHVAIPGDLPDFIEVVSKYAEKYCPGVILIHSTTVPGTVDVLVEKLGEDRVAHTQVHGKHARGFMCQDMLLHPKFVATRSKKAFHKAREVLEAMGHERHRIVPLSCPLAGELNKLLSTSLYAYLIVWAQEVERLGVRTGISYDELSHYLSLGTADYRVDNKFPGAIGGHCLMPNLRILQKKYPSLLWEAMIASNEEKRGTVDG